MSLDLVIKFEKYVLNDFGWKIYLNTPNSLILELYNYTFEDEENYVRELKDKKLIKNDEIGVYTYHNQFNSIYNSNKEKLYEEIQLQSTKDSLISDISNTYKMIYFEYNLYCKYSSFIWTVSCFMSVLLLKKMYNKFQKCKNMLLSYLNFSHSNDRCKEVETCMVLITNNLNTMIGTEYEIDEDFEINESDYYSFSNGLFNSNDVNHNENDDESKYNLINNFNSNLISKNDDDFKLIKKNSSPINSDFIKNDLRERLKSNNSNETQEEIIKTNKKLFKKRISFIHPSPSSINLDFFQRKIIKKRKSKNLSLNDLKNLQLFNKLETIDEEFNNNLKTVRSSKSKMKKKSKQFYIKTISTEEESFVMNKMSNKSINKFQK